MRSSLTFSKCSRTWTDLPLWKCIHVVPLLFASSSLSYLFWFSMTWETAVIATVSEELELTVVYV